jgi:hypothetical protein
LYFSFSLDVCAISRVNVINQIIVSARAIVSPNPAVTWARSGVFLG